MTNQISQVLVVAPALIILEPHSFYLDAWQWVSVSTAGLFFLIAVLGLFVSRVLEIGGGITSPSMPRSMSVAVGLLLVVCAALCLLLLYVVGSVLLRVWLLRKEIVIA